MKNFNRGGRELPFGKGEQVNMLSCEHGLYDRLKEQSNGVLARMRLLRRKDERSAKAKQNDRLLLPLGQYRSDERIANRKDDIFSFHKFVYTLPMIIFCVLFSWSLVSPAFGQEATGLNEVRPLHIGQRVPDEFWTKEHLFFINGDTIRRTLEEHKGKMLVLDFWFSGCTPCLLHQREIDHFKAGYPKELAVVMVNSKKTREKYDVLINHISSGRFQKAGMDGLISIIEDSYLESMFPYYCFPSYFWINESGVLQTHTFRNLLDKQYISPFLLKK